MPAYTSDACSEVGILSRQLIDTAQSFWPDCDGGWVDVGPCWWRLLCEARVAWNVMRSFASLQGHRTWRWTDILSLSSAIAVRSEIGEDCLKIWQRSGGIA